MARSQKAITDVLHDHKLWHEIRTEVMDAVRPLFTELFLAGVHGAIVLLRRAGKKAAGDDLIALAEDPAFAEKAAQYVTVFTNNWWNALEETTRVRLRDILFTATAEGTSVSDVIPQVAELFGAERASAIAVTETTRLFGAGAQAMYEATGITQWNWETAADDLVDEDCSAMAAAGPYDMDVDFEPLHVNCRCWISPVAA